MLLACLCAYLIGSINWSLIVSKIFFKTDIRKYYSHNAGATNINRKFGFKVAVGVLSLDALKVSITMLVCFILSLIHKFSSISYFIPVIFTALGHKFPIYFKFKGGKCVSIVLGFTMMINPIIFLIFFVWYWILLLSTRYASLASVLSLITLGLIVWIPQLSNVHSYINTDTMKNNYFLYFNTLHQYTNKYDNYYDNLLVINISLDLIILFTIFLHRKNIIKLIKKEEFKFSFKKIKN